ncbi:MAG TPA: T9SS type A sorting domain-containing protein [Bacteroidota bacterium]|nr:T9SS type A sorting domain-containing protein [Bacteroidota bacterium]
MNPHRLVIYLFPLLLLYITDSVFSQTPDCGITWSPTRQLSSDSVLSNLPQLAIAGDTIHVIWYSLDTLGTEAHAGIQYSRSTDGGFSWYPQKTLSPPDTAASPALLACSGSNVYVAFLGVIDTFYGTVVLRSTDAGTTWLPPQRVRSRGYLKTLCASEGNVFLGYYYYQSSSDIRNAMLLSRDAGATWILRNANMPPLVSVTMAGGKLHGVLTTPSTPIEVYYYYSSDSGRTWAFGETISREDFTNSLYPRIAANGNQEIYVVWNDTGAIKMRRSRNNGSAWLSEVKISEGDGAIFTDVAARDEFVCATWDGQGDLVVRPSNDFGYTFCPSELPAAGSSAGEPAIRITGTTLHLAWSETIGGNTEIFYRQGTLTKNPRLTDVPAALVLNDNYPNPFNDVTHISIELPSPSHVNLTVYNVLGQKVEQLLDQDMQAGRYEVQFSSRSRASGVYFYRLQTPTTVEMKKLIITR